MRRLLLPLLVACSSAETETETGGAVALYTAPGSGTIKWGAIPFPNDLYLGADGTIDLATLPRDAHDETVWQHTLPLLDKRKGFCATCSVYFPIDGDLKDASKSIDTPAANDPIVFVDLEEKKLLPIRSYYRAEDRVLGVRPAPGRVLLGKRKYAVAITTALQAADGKPLRASSGFKSARVTAINAVATTTLAGLGVPADRIAALTTFTVDDVTADVAAARAIAQKAEKPVTTLDKVWTADKLDDLMGVPIEKLYGRRKAADGHYGMLHDSIALVLTGKFRAPRVISGKAPDIGAPLRDANGNLTAGPLEDVQFLMTVPKGIDVARAPVVWVHTGLTGVMGTSLLLAEAISRAGAISISVEPALHGARATTAVDKRNTFRDIDGPDGLPEHDSADVGGRFVGFVGFEPGKKAWGGYVLGVMTQQTADVFASMRLLKEGDWSAIRAADPSLAGLAFDQSKLAYFGISNGAVVGTKVAIAEPGIAAILLNVPPANLAETLFFGPGFRRITSLSVAPSLLIPIPDDTVSIRFDPLFDIYRWTVEPMDPLALSPHFVRPLAEGPRPDILMQHAGHDELVVPMLADQLASSVGFPGVGAYPGAPVPAGTLPMRANFNGLTAGSVRFEGAGHTMIGFEEEESSWETLVPPYKPRAMKIMLKNPADAVQKQMETFYKSRFVDGRAQIVGTEP